MGHSHLNPYCQKLRTSSQVMHSFKGIGSILFLENGLKKNCRKNYKNHLKSNNYDVCTAVAHCFPSILDGMIIENVYYLQILNMKW
jgi:hypothetical protein